MPLKDRDKRLEYQRKHWRENRDRYSALKKFYAYGITPEQYADMLSQQEERCAICQRDLDLGRDTCVDHCHKTGIVRGILCSNCNYGLGQFKDNQDVLREAIKYLDKNCTINEKDKPLAPSPTPVMSSGTCSAPKG